MSAAVRKAALERIAAGRSVVLGRLRFGLASGLYRKCTGSMSQAHGLLQPREPLGGRGGEGGLELRSLQACPGRGAPLILHLAGLVFGIGHHVDCSSNDLSEWNRGLKRAARRGPYGNGAKQAWDKSGTIIPEVASRDPQHRGEAGSSAAPFPASPSGYHRARAHRFTGRPHPNSTLSASCLRSGPAGHLPTSPGSRCRRPQLR